MIKKLPLTILIAFLIQFTTQGQTPSQEFGKISLDELKEIPYSEEEAAEAVVLFDIGKSYFLPNRTSFDLYFERTTRIKIVSEAGSKWAEISIPFYRQGNSSERVSGIEAYAYNNENESVQKTSFKRSNIYEEKINDNWSVKKFAIPNVKEGTIIEYKYTVKSQYVFNLYDWEFQWRIPVLYSEYEVNMIPFFEYSYLLQGWDKLDSYSSYEDTNIQRIGTSTFNNMVHKFTMKDVPAFDSEEFITSVNDYITKIDFQLSRINKPDGTIENIMTTWEDVNKSFLDNQNFGEYINRSRRHASRVLDIKELSSMSEEERFHHVIRFVKGNYNWDKRNNKYASKSVNKFTGDKFGNSADINLFTIGLLNAVGIETKPVVISTRNHGKIRYDYPYTHFFNYVVILAKVNDEYKLADATEILSLNDRIPVRGLNDMGLVVQKDVVEWISMETLVPSVTKTDLQIEVTEDTTLHTNVSIEATEYDALNYRNSYSNNVKRIKESVETIGYSVIDSTIVVKNHLEIKKPYILTYEQTSVPEVVNEKIYIAPFLGESITDNPLKQKERSYPIDITYPQIRSFHSSIEIPDGYEVDYLPSELSINNQLFELNYSIESTEEGIDVFFDYYFKATIYSPEYYLAIQAFFDEIVKKGNERVVLSVKNI